MKAPEPGTYPNVPVEEYFAWDAASNSGLGRMLKSPAHYRAYVEEEWADTPAQIVGRAAHMAILEPDLFWKTFAKEPECDFEKYANPRATKAYKEEVAFIEDRGLTVLRDTDLESIQAMKAATLGHPKLRKVIQATGQAELSIVWDDPDTGVRCKARLDWHTPTHAGGAILDLKTTDDASPGSFERAVFRWGYHRQGALYLRGAREVGLPVRHFTIGAVEKSPPHGVILYRLEDDAISLGKKQIDFALFRYAECLRTDDWPCYTTDVVDIGVPAWADAAVERDLEEQVA